MIEAYIIDLERDTQYMRAIQDYITRESTLLSFMKGDIIKLTTRHSATDSGTSSSMQDIFSKRKNNGRKNNGRK